MMDGSLHSAHDRQNGPNPSGPEGQTPFKKVAVEGKSAYLTHSDGEKLRRLIEGTVASMTAEKLSTRYDRGLEHDRLYEKALAEFRILVLDPRTRLASLRAFLDHELPLGRPYYVKVLFLETIARLLGREWVSDDCDFIDVTIGTSRLQALAVSMSLDLRESDRNINAPGALILTPIGEQHTLMPHLIGLLFESLGWASQVMEPDATKTPALARAIETSDIVCIGWSNIRLATEFKTLIQHVRELRQGPRLPLVVGGAAALDSVDFLVGLGIDCICDSVYSAVKICESYYELERISQQARAAGRTAVVTHSGIDWLTP
ncbi:MAG: cobalamin-binding protein [Rhizobium sp.]|nr:cobalamin-binding protein [Rhizobium sp.]MCZ8348348.1 cobalamin-binding protein [Rhizobium sp.]